MGAWRLRCLAALFLVLVAPPPAQAARRAHVARSIAVRTGRYGAPDTESSHDAAEEEEERPRLPHENADVLQKLFGDMSLGNEEGAESKRPSMHYDEEDDAFLGVVAKLLEVIDTSPGEAIPKQTMSLASQNKAFPHFEEFVSDVFDEADEDQDGALNAAEAEHFTDLLRQHVAHAVFGGGGDEADMAVSRVMKVLNDHPEGGIELQALGEAAVTHFFPELLELVHELFEDADEDNDGVLNKGEASTFKQLFEETILAGHEAFAELQDLDGEDGEDAEAAGESGDDDSEGSTKELAAEGSAKELAAEEEQDEEEEMEGIAPTPTAAQEVMAEPVA